MPPSKTSGTSANEYNNGDIELEECEAKDNSELHPLLESKMESEKVIVIDGPNGDTSEWVTTSGVIDSSSSSSNGIDELLSESDKTSAEVRMTISTVEGTLSKIENSQEITKEQDSSSHPYQPTDYEEVFKEECKVESFEIEESLEPSTNLSRTSYSQYGGQEQNQTTHHETSNQNLPAQNSDTQSPSGPSVAQKIFNHLQMFQFYRDLGEYDKTLISVFKQHSFKLNDDLDVEFLKKWMKEFSKDEKCGEGYIDKWSLPSNKISRNEFVTKFEEIFVEDIEYGGQGMFSRMRSMSYQNPNDNIEELEKMWGIKPGVEQEWGNTFDKLVNYHNMPNDNLKDTMKSIFSRSNDLEESGRRNEILEEEMRNWIEPRLKPQLWKKYLWSSRYEKENILCNFKFEALFGTKDCRGSGPITKEKFICGIINELREGNKELIVVLKNICRRLERAEVYKIWPPKLFMVSITLIQCLMFAFHKGYYYDKFGCHKISPMCSMHIINPDRSWIEPWRFLTYGLVHNSFMHLFGNALCQLFIGLPLEFSHGSFRVGMIYLSGIFLGGLGREIFKPEQPLAGASGGMYALIAAHVAHLLLNWGNDSFVLFQRITCSKADHNTQKPTPFAVPSFVPVKWIRLVIVAILLIWMSNEFGECGPHSAKCPASVSHAAHIFGALGGFLTGYIFLEARNKNRWIQMGKIALLILVYGASIVVVAYHYHLEASKDSSPICTLSNYETTCQKFCYGANVTGICNSMTLCNVHYSFPVANKCL